MASEPTFPATAYHSLRRFHSIDGKMLNGLKRVLSRRDSVRPERKERPASRHPVQYRTPPPMSATRSNTSLTASMESMTISDRDNVVHISSAPVTITKQKVGPTKPDPPTRGPRRTSYAPVTTPARPERGPSRLELPGNSIVAVLRHVEEFMGIFFKTQPPTPYTSHKTQPPTPYTSHQT